MITYAFLGVLGIILQYIGISFGSNWYGFITILIGSLIFIMSFAKAQDIEKELKNEIEELKEQIKGGTTK